MDVAEIKKITNFINGGCAHKRCSKCEYGAKKITATGSHLRCKIDVYDVLTEAVKIIEELEKQIIDAKPKWIPKDKPPKSDVSVDVWLVLNTAEEHNLVVLGCYWNGKYRNIRGHDISGWVTHWMEYYVPEPPKEGDPG